MLRSNSIAKPLLIAACLLAGISVAGYTEPITAGVSAVLIFIAGILTYAWRD